MKRFDGRAYNTLRPLACELSTLAQADGSAVWKSGSTHVLASVHGPLAPRQPQHEAASQAQVSVILKSGSNATAGTLEREWEDLLRGVLTSAIVVQSYPRCVIQIVLQILSADGSILAACLHASVSALMDAGIDLNFSPTAVTCLIPFEQELKQTQKRSDGDDTTTSAAGGSTIRLEPCSEEEIGSGGVVVIIINGDSDHQGDDSSDQEEFTGSILSVHTSGNLQLSVPLLLQCCSAANKVRPAVTAFWRLAMEQKVTREAQTLWSS